MDVFDEYGILKTLPRKKFKERICFEVSANPVVMLRFVVLNIGF